MRKSMKSILAVLVLATPLVLSSCEGALDDLLGEWSRPTPGSSTGGGSGSGTVTAATITTAPTATAGDILDGSTTALVTAGVADGGTIMYKATSNTESKPTSTDGFSAEIPTAATNTVGTYFVWYYAKAADAQHSDSEIAATPVEVTVQPSLATPLTIETITTGTITVANAPASMSYSVNGVDKGAVQASIDVAIGDKVAFYGAETCYSDNTTSTTFGGTAQVKVYGNIMSLLYADFADKTELPAGTYTFNKLFYGYNNLTDASGLLLPATTLTKGCYAGMFWYCSSLTTAPMELPAMSLQNSCYQFMFRGCSSLTATPKLPATTLVSKCYQEMFRGCTSLTNAYVKAAYATIHDECHYMFWVCTKVGGTFYSKDVTTANAWITAFNEYNATYFKSWTGAVYPTE